MPNQPATVTAALKDATGENVAPQEYSLCLESGAQAFSAALPQNSGEPRKLYKAAVSTYAPRANAPLRRQAAEAEAAATPLEELRRFSPLALFAALRVKRKTR